MSKTEKLSLRVEPMVKDALRAAAERERRSLASMIEIMVLHFCEARGIKVPASGAATGDSRKNSQSSTRTR
jgi:hypothetical protein